MKWGKMCTQNTHPYLQQRVNKNTIYVRIKRKKFYGENVRLSQMIVYYTILKLIIF